MAVVGVARDISERRKAEKALRESDKRFRSLIENTSDIVCVLRPDGVIAYVSPSVERILGFRPEELIGSPGFQLLHPDDYAIARNTIGDALAHPGITGPFVDIRYRQKNGTWKRMQGIGKAIVEDSGQRSVVLSLRDITERRRTEQVQAAVYRISEAAHIATDQAQLFSSVHSIIAELMTARNFYIALYNRDEDMLEFPYHQDEFDTVWSPMRPGKSLTGYVLRTGKPLLVTQSVFDRLVASGEVELVGTPSSDWLGVPLKRQTDEVFGVMVVQTYGDSSFLREEEKNVLMFVSTQIAMAIERTRAMTDLKESEERYRHLFHRSPVAIFHYDPDLRITVFNDQFVALLQSTSDRLKGLDMHQLRDRRVLPAISEALAGREGSY